MWKHQEYSNKSQAAHPIDVDRGCPPIVWIPASWSWRLQLFPISSRECSRKGRDGTAVHMPAGNQWLRIFSHKWCLSIPSWRQGTAMSFELDLRAEFYYNPRYALLCERKVCQDTKNQDVNQAIGQQIPDQSFKPTSPQLNAAWTTLLWGFHLSHPSLSRGASIRSSSKGMPSLKTSSRPWSLHKHQRHYFLELDVFCGHMHSAQY